MRSIFWKSILGAVVVIGGIFIGVEIIHHRTFGSSRKMVSGLAKNVDDSKQFDAAIAVPRDRAQSVIDSNQSRSSLPPSDSLPDRIVDARRQDASSGVPDAMREMGQALAACARRDKRSDADYETAQIDVQLQVEAAMKSQGGRLSSDDQIRNVAKAMQDRKALDESCAKLERGQIDSWPQWLERAALAGDTQARRDYTHWAYDEYRTQGLQPADLDEALRRRDLVAQFASDLLAQGDCSALNELQWAVPDAVQSYAYRLSLQQYLKKKISSQGGDPDALSEFDAFLADQGKQLTPQQLSAANEKAVLVTQTYCSH